MQRLIGTILVLSLIAAASLAPAQVFVPEKPAAKAIDTPVPATPAAPVSPTVPVSPAVPTSPAATAPAATTPAVTTPAATAPATTTAPVAAKDTPERLGVLQLLAKLETSLGEGDAKAAAACWTVHGEFVGPGGARADGRDAIEKVFAEGLAARRGGKLQMHLLGLRMVNADVAMVDAVPEIKPAAGQPAPVPRTATLVVVKENGRWLIESARETGAAAPAQANGLKDLAWLIGEWASETSKGGLTLRTSCDLTAGGAFLIRKFKIEGQQALLHGGTEIIGWDPKAGRVRSWVFDTDGGFGESLWVRDGDRWLVRYSGTLADGSDATATHILTKVDAQTVSMQSKDRVVNGQPQADIPETTLKRQAAPEPPAKADAPAKPAAPVLRPSESGL